MKLYMCVVIAWLLCLLFAGCAQLDITRTAIDVRGQVVADRVLADAEFVLCRGITVGAWVRRFGRDAALAEGWKTICGSELLLTTPTATK